MDHPCGPGPWTASVDHPSFCKFNMSYKPKNDPHTYSVPGQFKKEPMTKKVSEQLPYYSTVLAAGIAALHARITHISPPYCA